MASCARRERSTGFVTSRGVRLWFTTHANGLMSALAEPHDVRGAGKTDGVAGVITACYHDNMVRTQISVDEVLYRRAKLVARRRGISLAELCRRSLEETVSREPSDKPWMAYAGILDGSPTDSESVDDVVYGREAP